MFDHPIFPALKRWAIFSNKDAKYDPITPRVSNWITTHDRGRLTRFGRLLVSIHPAAERLDRPKPVTAFSSFYRSSIGKKMIVALTGVVLIAFVVGHLLGNLQIFLGPDWINSYAEHLRELGPLLWVIRAFLLVNVLIHIFFTISLAIDNRS